MTDSSQVALARAFVGVSYLLGARGAELTARTSLDPTAGDLTRLLRSSSRQSRARAIASAVLGACRDLDERRIG